MVKCPDCGEEVPNAKFCKNCGASLPEVNEIVEVKSEIVEATPAEVSTDVEEIDLNDSSSQSKINFCHSCGTKLDGTFKFCPNCGYDLENNTGGNRQSTNSNVNRQYDDDMVSSTEEKNVLVSVILSIIVPGLGHFYLGLSRKGATFLIGYVISAILIILLVGFILVIGVWIWALIDVVQSTNALNNGESVKDKLI